MKVNLTALIKSKAEHTAEIREVLKEQGEDKMKQEIERNYRQIKMDNVNIIENEMVRIKMTPIYSIW